MQEADTLNSQSAYLYLSGIQRLAREVRGDEKIYTGIRPYALHAGNVLSIVAYPYLLCEAVRKRGIEPQFEFMVSINDWEQDQLIGPDIHKYTFDTKPLHTTIAHTFETDGQSTVEKWQPHIENEINKIKKDFPSTIIKFIRNSSLRDYPLMRQALTNTIQDYKQHKELLAEVTDRPTLSKPMRFANALCSSCLDANTNTSIDIDGLIHTVCEKCGKIEERDYEDCDFWLYHKQLFPPRLAILDFQITISGADHFLQGDFQARKALYEYIYNKPMPPIKMVFAPLLLASDGEKMSKSRKNDTYLPLEDILPHVRTSHSESLRLTD